MNRIDIINGLIVKNNYKTYLEIGVRDGSCFNAINCHGKIGVDPDQSSAANVKITSDEFFENIYKGVTVNPVNGTFITAPSKYDIIFIDGLHHADQVIKDIENSLKHLNEGGTIVMHDCLPTSEFMQLIPQRPDHNEWTGDVWKAFVHYRQTRDDLEMRVVDTDYGCGIIRKGKQELLTTIGPVNYQNFAVYKSKWMNVISVDQFRQRYL